MNRIWQQLAIATNWPALVAVVVLSAVGILTIWAHSPGDGKTQLAFLGAAVASMAMFQAVNYQKIGRLAWGFYLLSLGLIAYTVLGALIGGGQPAAVRQEGERGVRVDQL